MTFMTKRKEKAKNIIAYQKLFATEDGKRVLADLLRECGFMSVGLGEDAQETAYNQGKREVVLRIVNLINIDPETILKLLRDNRKE